MRPKSKLDRDWLIETVSFYRGLGFFHQWENASIEEVAAHLDYRYRQNWARELDPYDKHTDLLLLRYDSTRVWWHDTEADVASSNEVYRQTILEWAVISRGAFLPTEVHETWVSEDGPVYISFTLPTQSIKFRANYHNDYIDMGILKPINHSIADSGMQFKMYEVFDQSAFVVMLKSEEVDLLKNQRGWYFESDM